MWLDQASAGREAAATVKLKVADEGQEFLAEVQQGKGAMAEFVANVAKVLVPARDGARRQLAEALLRLQKVPRSLAKLWELDSQGSTWRCITSTDNVTWCVHPLGSEEPTHDVAIVGGTSWRFLRASVYGTIVVKLMMAACEEALQDCTEEEKAIGCQAVAVHFNTAAAAEGHTGRLLPSTTAQRLWRFDTNPDSARANYGGRAKRLTATQTASDHLEGRSRRAVLRR